MRSARMQGHDTGVWWVTLRSQDLAQWEPVVGEGKGNL